MKNYFRRAIAMILILFMVLEVAFPMAKVEAAVPGETEICYETEGLILAFSVSSAWNNGYNAGVTITNTTDKAVDNWAVKLYTEDTITNIWNAVIVEKTEDGYLIQNDGWNQDIKSGASVEFGFNCAGSFSKFPNCEMVGNREIAVKDAGNINYTVVSDWKSGFNGEISLTNQSPEALTEWQLTFEFDNEISNIWNAQIIRHNGSTYCIKGLDYNQNLNAGETICVGFTVNNGQAEKEASGFKLTERVNYGNAKRIPLSAEEYFLDYDADGVPNIYEYFFQLDPNNADTDGDGVSDLKEMISSSKELLAADSDEDGISNASELMYGLNPFKKDTFDDGILDGDRVLSVSKKGEKSDLYEVFPSVSLNVSGKSLDSFKVEKIGNSDLFLNDSIPGVLSNGYELSVNEQFDEAILEFVIPEDFVGDPDVEPVIYYWNRETQTLEEVPNQTISGNKVTARLTHFSPYILINKKKWLESRLASKILNPKAMDSLTDKMNFVLLLDESGSISYSNYNTMKNSCKALVNSLSGNDKVALFTFDHTVRKQYSFLGKDSAATKISSLSQHDGSTAVRDALLAGINEHKTYSTNDEKRIIVLLTDGYTNSDTTTLSYADLARMAADNEIVVYTIGIGTSIDRNDLNLLTNQTGGQFYNVSDFNKLLGVLDDVISDSDLYLDSDGDGISDYHEKKIAQGFFRLNSGSLLTGEYTLDYLNPDSDGDGLLDGEELRITEGADGAEMEVFSSPVRVDTDYDGMADFLEDVFGYSQLVYTNVTVTSNSPMLAAVTTNGFSMPGVWIGTWLNMAQNHSWNYIHNQVVKYLCSLNPSYTPEYIIPGAGRADIIDTSKFEIWEVKPISYSEGEKFDKVQGQISRYINGMTALGEVFTAGKVLLPIPAGSFLSDDGEYTIYYSQMGQGLVLYSFKKNQKNPNEDEEPVEVPSVNPVYEEDEDTVPDGSLVPGYSLATEQDAIDMLNNNFNIDVLEMPAPLRITLALLLVSVTLGEDVVTGGVGIADDAVCFVLAFFLMFGYMPDSVDDAREAVVA